MTDQTLSIKNLSEADLADLTHAFDQHTDLVKRATETLLSMSKAFSIGGAVAAMELGKRVRRAGWNGKGMHLELQVPDAHSKMGLPYAYLTSADGKRVPWTCSQTDLLAKDWEIVS